MNLFESDKGTMILENDILKVNINMNFTDDCTLDSFLKCLDNIYNAYILKKKKFTLFIDCRNFSGLPSYKFCKKIAHYFNTNKERTALVLYGTICLSTNSYFANFVNFFLNFYSAVKPIKIIQNEHEIDNEIKNLIQNETLYNNYDKEIEQNLSEEEYKNITNNLN